LNDFSTCNFIHPKRRFWKAEQKWWNPDFRLSFQWFLSQIEYSLPWKVLRKSGFHHFCSSFQNLRLGSINFSFADGACITTRIKPCIYAFAMKFVTALARRSHPRLSAIEHFYVVVFIWCGKRDRILQQMQRLEANTARLAWKVVASGKVIVVWTWVLSGKHTVMCVSIGLFVHL